jgi:hypothetical protein
MPETFNFSRPIHRGPGDSNARPLIVWKCFRFFESLQPVRFCVPLEQIVGEPGDFGPQVCMERKLGHRERHVS